MSVIISFTFQVIANDIVMNALYALIMETIIIKMRNGNEIPVKIALETSTKPGNKH